jgi:ubiquinone/menaquinone biosynthesis C-methylase UbiE
VGREVALVLGEAEDLPVRGGTFDAALSIGGFNYFNDPELALREMARAVRPGGTIVVSDEVPDLTDRMLFRKIGLTGVDRWIVSRLMHLGDEFTEMVERYRELDVEGIARGVLPDCRFERIWRGLGYVFSGRVPG